MFFAKALGGSLVVVFGGFWAAGAFDPPLSPHERRVLAAVEKVRQAENKDNQTATWGPHCDELRDKVFGFSGGDPAAAAPPASGMAAIATVHKAAAELEAAGCDPDAAPGAFSPFAPGKHEFREVTTQMPVGPSAYSGQGSHARAPKTTQELHGGGSWGKPQN